MDYFQLKKGIIKIKKDKNPLAYSFLNIIQNIDENKTIKKDALLKFKDYINSKNPIPKDLKDLLLFILQSLHNELNEAKNINQKSNDCCDKNFGLYYHKYKKYFKNNYNSIIAQLFYLKYNSETHCFNCDFISNNIQCTNILIFPLEEVIKENENKKIITIYDCFAYYQKQNYKIGICNNCKQNDYLANNDILLRGPKILIINIVGEIKNKMDIKLELDEKIKIKEFFKFKKKEYNYKLINLISNIGYAHYIAFFKSFYDNKWYKYNNSSVNESMFKEIKDTGFPYLLFYSLAKNDN